MKIEKQKAKQKRNFDDKIDSELSLAVLCENLHCENRASEFKMSEMPSIFSIDSTKLVGRSSTEDSMLKCSKLIVSKTKCLKFSTPKKTNLF